MVAVGAIIMIWPFGALTAVPRPAGVPPGSTGAPAGIPVRVAGFAMPAEVVMMPSVLAGTRFCPTEDGNTWKTVC